LRRCWCSTTTKKSPKSPEILSCSFASFTPFVSQIIVSVIKENTHILTFWKLSEEFHVDFVDLKNKSVFGKI
jgi:hypothetical protein